MDDFEKLYNKSVRFLSFRPRSEKELRDHLKLKSKRSKITPDEDLINSVIVKLKTQRFLNDEEFAKFWIRQRTEIKPKSFRIIKAELRQKGISDEIMEEIDAENVQTDLESALKILDKKKHSYKNLSKEEAYTKMSRYLSSKGFGWETIKEAISDFGKQD